MEAPCHQASGARYDADHVQTAVAGTLLAADTCVKSVHGSLQAALDDGASGAVCSDQRAQGLLLAGQM